MMKQGYLNPRQQLILRAALSEPQAAVTAFERWEREYGLEDITGDDLRLIPLVYKNIGQHLSPGLTARLRGISKYVWIRNQYRIEFCTKLIAQLNQHSVQTLLLKGTALMASVTDDFGTRQMGDCDLLVASKDRNTALEVLSAERMQSIPDWKNMSSVEIEQFHGLTFELPGKVHDVIDLHWRPLREVRSNELTDIFFEYSRPVSLGKETTSVPCPEHLLLHILVHGSAVASTARYDWLADASLILRHSQEFDWRRLAATAEKFRLNAIAAKALGILSEETGIEIPLREKAELKGSGFDIVDGLEVSSRFRTSEELSDENRAVDWLQAARRSHSSHSRTSTWRLLPKAWRLLTTGFVDQTAVADTRGGACFLRGWHVREPAGRWTASKFATACIYSHAKRFGNSLKLSIMLPLYADKQFVAVFCGFRPLAFFKLDAKMHPSSIEVPLPPRAQKQKTLPLQFYVFRKWVASLEPGSTDFRRIGIFIYDINTPSDY